MEGKEKFTGCEKMGISVFRGGGFHEIFLRNIFTQPEDPNCARDDESRCLGPLQDKVSHI